MTRYNTAVSAHELDDLMGLMFDKPEPHLAEDENLGDEAFINIDAYNGDMDAYM